jgi:F-type H+-transporting ATPase subunit b
MEILNNFGFEPILFAAQIVNFLIIFFLMKKLMYKPMLKMLEDRKRKIAEGIKNAEEANKKLEEMILKEEEILKKAQEQAVNLIEEAKVQQAEIMRQTEETTRAQTEKMLKDAREQIAFETAQVEKRLMSHVSKLAVQFLQQSVQELFGANEQEAIMKNALKKLKEKRAD